MPQIPPTQQLVLVDRFIAHWADVDDALAPNQLVLSGFGRSDLVLDRQELASYMTDLVQRTNDWEGASVERDHLRRIVRERMRQFRQTMFGLVLDTAFLENTPVLPPQTSSASEWQNTIIRVRHLWERVNSESPEGITPPLLLAGGYGLAEFEIDSDRLIAAFHGVRVRLSDRRLAIAERDLVMKRIREKLVRYRSAVRGSFEAGHPLIATLPELQRNYPRKKQATEG